MTPMRSVPPVPPKGKKELTEFARIAHQCMQDSERWFGDSYTTRSLAFMALALAGEVGELCNEIKKIERGSQSIQDAAVRYRLMMETTDVFIYLANIAGLLNIDLSESYKHVRALNEKRFTAQRAEREAKRNGS